MAEKESKPERPTQLDESQHIRKGSIVDGVSAKPERITTTRPQNQPVAQTPVPRPSAQTGADE
jgi:hypothetical protein